MLEIGLTGGIGSGKSIVAKILLDMGFSVFNSDDYSKTLLNNNSIKNEMKKNFGDSYFENDILNRKKLGELVFKNKQELDKLNRIIHPEVARGYESWKGKLNQPIVFKEAAILLESGSYKGLDKLILVKAPLETRIKRVMSRDAITADEVLARMKNQWTDEEKEKLVDYVIINDDYHSLIGQIHSILNSLK